MKIIDRNDQLQNDALLNEYKGNIFEFLVGQHISKLLNLENQFLDQLNTEQKIRLSMYEEFIRINYSDLLNHLLNLSKYTAQVIFQHINKHKLIVTNIHLIGKSVAINNNSLWSETDLVFEVLIDKEIEHLKLSLKLSKSNSFTNTKSAGVKSFLQKYFSSFEDSKFDQLKFNDEINFQFNKMGSSLYSDLGLDFNGQFDHRWTEQFSELPGELNSVHREYVFLNYSNLNKMLYSLIEKYFHNNRTRFIQCLAPLLGFSDNEILQIITYHKEHEFKSVRIISIDDLISESNSIDLLPLKDNSHSFEIKLNDIILQIRIKPMNKFTTASYKVNCSIKEL